MKDLFRRCMAHESWKACWCRRCRGPSAERTMQRRAARKRVKALTQEEIAEEFMERYKNALRDLAK